MALGLISGFALQGAIEAAVLPVFAGTVDPRWMPTSLALRDLEAGGTGDVVVLTDEALSDLSDKAMLVPGSTVTLADAVLGLGMAPGRAGPDISTKQAFVAAILSCRALAYSRAGASGIYFEGLIDRLGIGDAVRAKAVVIPSGLTGEKLLTGEADLALQQISELMMVDGTEIIGPLPEEIGCVTGFSAAVLRTSRAQDDAARLVAALSSPAAMAGYAAAGLRPRHPTRED